MNKFLIKFTNGKDTNLAYGIFKKLTMLITVDPKANMILIENNWTRDETEVFIEREITDKFIVVPDPKNK